ncbi:0e517988-b052-413b-9ef9-b736729d3b88 [Thermothielavioides terrestris]|uniref:0e517988-b052-413b-9ef9-b736729d3b88 n=1 Tax=Thermothielavioides terrestris TaxID=2587410 RepID=A0A3S4D5M1_9PEZI|nr:0e517988-b052-413b-9ef9-b736729d3b88 [Thermothielavioides terrestris]
MVPDLLLVRLGRRETQIDIPRAAGDGAVLGLRVHPDAGLSDAQLLRDPRGLGLVRVARLDALAEARARHLRDRLHRDPLALRQRPRAQRPAPGPLPDHRREDHAPPLLIRLVGADIRRQRRGIVHRQVRAPEHAHLDIPILQQRQRHRVLPAPQKPLGPIDRIDRPHPTAPAALALPAIDQRQHVLHIRDRAAQQPLGRDVVQAGLAHEPPDALAQRRVRPQRRGLLLGDDGVVREARAQRGDDQRLRAEVAHRHRRRVVLGHRALGPLLAEDALGQLRRALHGQLRDLQLGRVDGGHCCCCCHVAGGGGGRGVSGSEVAEEQAEAGDDAVAGGGEDGQDQD